MIIDCDVEFSSGVDEGLEGCVPVGGSGVEVIPITTISCYSYGNIYVCLGFCGEVSFPALNSC